MGIHRLKMYLQTHCLHSTKLLTLSELAHKHIVVDVNIYMHQFEMDHSLVEQMYSMLALFRHHNIMSTFVFDGKTPERKQQCVEQRKLQQMQVMAQIEELKTRLQQGEGQGQGQLKQQLLALEKQNVHVSEEQRAEIKELIRAFGFPCIDALEEADNVCAQHVIQDKAWACLSDDTDMFVYGCKRVLRSFNVRTQTVMLFNTVKCLCELDMTPTEFQEVSVLAGTDYNASPCTSVKNGFPDAMELFKQYKASLLSPEFGTVVPSHSPSFHAWLQQEHKVNANDVDMMKDVIASVYQSSLHDADQSTMENASKNVPSFDWNHVKHIMDKHHFVFLPTEFS